MCPLHRIVSGYGSLPALGPRGTILKCLNLGHEAVVEDEQYLALLHLQRV